jgi:hypothetical protein
MAPAAPGFDRSQLCHRGTALERRDPGADLVRRIAQSVQVSSYPRRVSDGCTTLSDDSAYPLHRFLQDLIAKWPDKLVGNAVI